MENPSLYKPIDCNFYDVLEAKATLKKQVHVIYLDEANTTKSLDALIVNLYTRNKEEFIVFDNGFQLRLDRLIQVDDKKLSNFCQFH